MQSTHGQFIWYDLVTTDIDAAIAFFTGAIGWTTQKWDRSPYTMFTNDAVPLGGVVKTGSGMGDAPPHWLAYVSVDDVDATAAKAASLGGKIIAQPKDIPGSGRYAILSDPQGASIAIYKSSSPATGLEVIPGRGQFSWFELATTDYKAALDFYSGIFGWEGIEAHDMGPNGIYQIYGLGGKPLGGMANRFPDDKRTPAWLCYILVDSVEKTVERVKELGGTLVVGPYQVPGNAWIAHCKDPQGGMFALQSGS